AESLFLRHELFGTRRRRAVLILVSRFERRVEIVADIGLHEHVGDAEWRQVIETMASHLRDARPFHALEAAMSAVESLLVSNGFLVVVVRRDGRMRIQWGYGLEPILTDAMAGAIIRDIMAAAFKRADYDAGVQNGVAAIIARLEGKSVATAAPAAARPPARSR